MPRRQDTGSWFTEQPEDVMASTQDQYIADLLKTISQTQAGSIAAGSANGGGSSGPNAGANDPVWTQYLAMNPDVRAEFDRLMSGGRNLQNNYNIHTPEEFAKWHWEHYGQNEPDRKTPWTAPTPTPEPTPTPTPAATPTRTWEDAINDYIAADKAKAGNTINTPTTPYVNGPTGTVDASYGNNSPKGTNGVAPPIPADPVLEKPGPRYGSPNESIQSALAKARLQARLKIQSRGLNPDEYMSYLDSAFTDEVGFIPKDAINLDNPTNFDSYFDPTITDSVLSGIENQQRNQYASAARSAIPRHVDSHLLDTDIEQLLGSNQATAQEALDRGLKRGQLNQVGYQGGENKLSQLATVQRGKLQGTAYDILNSYDSGLADTRKSALDAANAYTLGSTFNLDDYTNDANDILGQANTQAHGKFLSAAGTDPLFDISTLLGAGGQKQGAQNLRNLDVIEAIDKNKQRNEQGRGLGSQGAF